jgi:hypothetical protein
MVKLTNVESAFCGFTSAYIWRLNLTFRLRRQKNLVKNSQHSNPLLLQLLIRLLEGGGSRCFPRVAVEEGGGVTLLFALLGGGGGIKDDIQQESSGKNLLVFVSVIFKCFDNTVVVLKKTIGCCGIT